MRYIGSFPVSTNVEPRIKAPFDARQLVGSAADLINPATWTDNTGLLWIYKGMLVVVGSDADSSKNGIYILSDVVTYTNIESWLKIGDGFWEDDITPKVGYGYLYNWYAIQESQSHGGLIDGFTVPTETQWTELITLMGGSTFAGGKLKSVRTDPDIHPRWDTGNITTDEVNLSLVPGGIRTEVGVDSFTGIGNIAGLWGSTDNGTTGGCIVGYVSNAETVNISYIEKYIGNSIRCIRELDDKELLLSNGTYLQCVYDYDDNRYEVVKIGNYGWVAQNLATSHFVDGTAIPNITDGLEWDSMTGSAYCIYNNNVSLFPGLFYTDEEINRGIKPIDNERIDARYINNLPKTPPTEEIFPMVLTRDGSDNVIRTYKTCGSGKFIESRVSWTVEGVVSFEEVKNDLTGEFKKITYNYSVGGLLESTTVESITAFTIVIP